MSAVITSHAAASQAVMSSPGQQAPSHQAKALTKHQLLECATAFENQLKSDGEQVAFDDSRQYKSILHRAQWRKWLQAWSASMQVDQPTDEALHAPRTLDDSLTGFLNNCRVSGVFFDGQTAKGKPGIYFMSMRQINEHVSGVNSGLG